MITIRARSSAIAVCVLLLVTGCSREQQDWRSAEAADTIEAYSHFIQHHPESELAAQARTRVAQLGEDRDWQHAGSADTVDAYREFIAQHPNGKWAQEARIRIENFSLGEQTGTDAASRSGAGAGGAAGRGRDRALPGGPHPGDAGGPGTQGDAAGVGANGLSGSREHGRPGVSVTAGAAGTATASSGLALPGEAAVPAGSVALRYAPSGSATPGGAAAGGRPGEAAGASGGKAPQGAPGSVALRYAPSPPTAASGPGVGGGGFGIQLGAFSSEAGATTEWNLLVGRFGSELQGLQEHVVPADTPSGRIYRLQALVGEEARARAICDSLRRRSQGCVAVLPH